MRIIKPGYDILTPISEGGIKELQRIELAARTCYKSEDKADEYGDSAKKMVKMLIDRGHEAMLEHSQLSVRFICDRGVSHELVRHRIASFAQESSRYCNYTNDKFNGEITFIEPCFYDEIPEGTKNDVLYVLEGDLSLLDEETVNGYPINNIVRKYFRWLSACQLCENTYITLIGFGATPQEARNVLNNSVKTEIVVTANYREWRNIFKLRCAENAHPQMQEIMIPLCLELQSRIPIMFDDCYQPKESCSQCKELVEDTVPEDFKDTGGWSLEVTPG